jgi:hypothetical protein
MQAYEGKSRTENGVRGCSACSPQGLGPARFWLDWTLLVCYHESSSNSGITRSLYGRSITT